MSTSIICNSSAWDVYLKSSIYLFIYSIIYLCQYRFMNIYFILRVTIQYYFIHFIAQIIPALAIRCSSFGSYIPLTYDHHCGCFWIFYFYFCICSLTGTRKCCRLKLYLFHPIPRISLFSMKPLASFNGECIRN